MLLKEQVNKCCSECGCSKRMVSPEVYGCDNCKKEIMSKYADSGNHHEVIKITVFYSSENQPKNDERTAYDREFCSWKCCFEWIKNNKDLIKDEDFMNLPYVYLENGREVSSAISFNALLECIK